jgi:hypothetical protein
MKGKTGMCGRLLWSALRPIPWLAPMVRDRDDHDLRLVEAIEDAEGKPPQDITVMTGIDAGRAVRCRHGGMFISALALPRMRRRLSVGSTGTTLGDLRSDV